MKLIALACVVVALMAPAAQADVGNRSPLDIEFDELNGAIARGDCTEGLSLTHRITARGAFKGFPDQAKGAIWTFAAICADRKGLFDEALADARNASLVPGADASAWSLRFSEAVKAGQLDDVPAGVETLAHTSPAALNALPVGAFRGFKTAAVAAGHAELAMRVYAALEAANYTPVENTAPGADLVWLDYAGLVADAGDARHASALIARLASVSGLISAKLDGRFAAAVAADPARFDLKAAALRQLDHDRADMAAHPDRLTDLSPVVIDLMAVERFDEALTLTQSALDRIAQAPKGKPPFVDQARWLNWLYDTKSRALIRLGRFDAGLQAMRDGARLPEQGQLNVSQTINLAGNLNDLGQPGDALAELKPFDGSRGASPYGEAWAHATRACAYQQLGQAAQRAPELGWLAAHRRDNTGARLQALLCAGSADDAAAELIAELNDPDLREAGLVRLSEFDPPLGATPIRTAERALLAAIRARPDIRAAIAAAGHTERIPLCECAYVDEF